ncbi:MAG: peptidylprolyl isomerase [Saprospiraceae bacterium]
MINTARKRGRIGYIPAPFPNGLYKLEYAAYTSPLNQLVGPIRTNAGYHLLVVHARRPARGEVEAAHIMVRNEGKTPEAAKARIDSVYQVLQGGAAFDALAKAVSEDRRTAENGGYVGFFGVNRYEQPFEDVAFGLANDNTFSQPFQTSLGWHVVKRISKKEIQPFAAEKPRLDARIRQDGRFEEAKRGLLDNIRKENNFMEQTALLNEFIASLPDTFTTFRWKAPATPDARVLFSIGKNFPVTLGEFATYMDKATRQRVSYAKEGDANYVARKLYDEFVDSQLLKYEETQLEDRYPEFKSLMREYEEGILLFEATKMEVWDKAAQDTVGLERFFNGAPGKYRWAPRASTTTYRIKLDYKDEAAAIREYARTHTPEEVKAKYNTEEVVKVTTDQSLVEKFRSTELGNNAWEAGALTELEENTRSKSINFIKVEEILPESNKTLHEARGYVIADYQDQLERQWVEDLRKRYAVSIDQKVFNSLVK